MVSIISLTQSKTFSVMAIASMFLHVCMYVIQINVVISATYRISRYEKDFQALSQEAKVLQAEQSTVRSFKTIEELASTLQFEKVTRDHYLQAGGAVVAQRIAK